MHGDGVLLKNKQPDPDFPPAGEHMHLDQGAHERMGSFRNGSSVGLFRHEDESFSPYFIEFVTIYPGRYRVRTSLWSFQWDKGKVLPARGTEAARLSVVQLTGDGRGGGHPSNVLGYYDAPSLAGEGHDFDHLAEPQRDHRLQRRLAGARRQHPRQGPGHGLHRARHRLRLARHRRAAARRLAADEPSAPVRRSAAGRVQAGRPSRRPAAEAQAGPPGNRRGQEPPRSGQRASGPCTASSRWSTPTACSPQFLPRAFRRPVDAEVRKQYVARVEERLKAGDCFETAMRWAYRAALCSPDFLYHVEPAGKLDDHALACRLSYFFWRLDARRAADRAGRRRQAARRRDVLRAEVERLLNDPKSQRFVEDFLGQWLKLRQIAANDPDRKLYPEFSPYLQDSMVAETRAYFRELLDKNLDAGYLVKSDFAMLNEKLAVHYGIPGVSGSQIRRVALPAGCPRGAVPDAGGDPEDHRQRHDDLAGAARRVRDGPPARPAARAAAAEHPGHRTRRARRQDHPRAARQAPRQRRLRLVPREDRPARLRPGIVRRHRRLRARATARSAPATPRRAARSIRSSASASSSGPTVDASGVLPDGRKFSGITEFQDLLAADRGPAAEEPRPAVRGLRHRPRRLVRRPRADRRHRRQHPEARAAASAR